ncbi:MAG: hypothetical protein JSS66_06915 [Armatimonadetes bacterium]|nr:hypothetical protein [Armatimonadota bacterium]
MDYEESPTLDAEGMKDLAIAMYTHHCAQVPLTEYGQQCLDSVRTKEDSATMFRQAVNELAEDDEFGITVLDDTSRALIFALVFDQP